MSHPMLLSPIARHSELLIPRQALHRHNRKWQKTVNGARGYAASEIASCQQEPKAGTQVNVQKKSRNVLRHSGQSQQQVTGEILVLANHLSIITSTKANPGRIVDVLADELNRTVSKANLSPASVPAGGTHHG